MHLKHLKANWERYAKEDPMWAILTEPDKKGNKWDSEEFFASGRSEVDALMKYLESLGLHVPLDTALDFGCGLGRLSQGLCRYFPRVHGVDIAATMIEEAKKYNRYGDKCKYHLNPAPDLRLFESGSMTLVFTVITLQHIPSHLQRGYIKEFFRLLKPGGVVVFRTLSSSSAWRFAPSRLLNFYRMIKHRRKSFFGCYGLSTLEVVNCIRRAGCDLVELKISPCDEGRFKWLATQYCAVRPK